MRCIPQIVCLANPLSRVLCAAGECDNEQTNSSLGDTNHLCDNLMVGLEIVNAILKR